MRAMLLLLALLVAPAPRVETATPSAEPAGFATVDVFVDAGPAPLAAYQLEFRAENARIVGIEGGEHPAYAEPPYHDPRAIQNDRAILAAFSTADAADLPRGRTRVATIHLTTLGDTPPRYETTLTLATDPAGERVPAEAEHRGER